MSKQEFLSVCRTRDPQHAVQHALKYGVIVRQPCEVCGNPRSEAHHPDYTKLLDVQWLCHPHHMQEHKKIRASDNPWGARAKKQEMQRGTGIASS